MDGEPDERVMKMSRYVPRNPEKRAAILRYIGSFCTEYGFAPSVREIGAAVGISSTSTTAGYLSRMVRDGLLEKSSTRSRAYVPAGQMRRQAV